jgi:hypothetical protein
MTTDCPRCHRVLPVTRFGGHRGRKDGRQTWCLACGRAYQRRRYARQRGYTWVADEGRGVRAWPPAARG